MLTKSPNAMTSYAALMDWEIYNKPPSVFAVEGMCAEIVRLMKGKRSQRELTLLKRYQAAIQAK